MKTCLPFFTALCISGTAFSQWSASSSVNTPVCQQPYDQQDVRIVTDGKGGAIITWMDFRNDPTMVNGDVFVQRIDKNGVAKWTAHGVAICVDASNQTAPSLVEDGKSGAIIAWNDWRSGNRDVYAQKIDSVGNVQWAANGVALVSKAGQQQDAKLISDGAGGAIAVWQDSTVGGWDIYSQRVNSVGAVQWTAGGVMICISADAQINPRIETDGAGGAIIVWQDKRNTVDYDIYTQRINGAGAVQWTPNGVPVSTSLSTQSNPKIEPDGSGGAIMAWQDKRNGIDYNVFAQRINATGVVQWTANGVAICSAGGSQSAVDLTSDGISGAIITWKDMRGANFDVYAQKVDLAGAVKWTANGVGIVTGGTSQLNPNVVGDGSGGAIIVWQDSSATNSDIKSQRVDGNGIVLWTAGGIAVGNATGDQLSPKNVSDGSGGCIYTWQDRRGADLDIYAHHVYIDGTTIDGINGQNMLVDSRCFPNPFSTSAVIEMDPNVMNDGRVDLLLFDVLGEVQEIPFSVSENRIHISRGGLTEGVYFYEIRSNGRVVSKGKLILSDGL